jgi:hypothetical protein
VLVSMASEDFVSFLFLKMQMVEAQESGAGERRERGRGE